jgi:FHA domain/Double zinc ribbon
MTSQITVCPKCGQASSESDFCSECGARIDGAPMAASTLASAPSMSCADVCPSCQTPRPTLDARFCEVCRYDFVKQSAGEPPIVAPVAVPDPVPVTTGAKWDVIVAVDASLDIDPDPELKPPDEPERRIPLDREENLIGRRDDKQNLVPDVRPHDPSVSRRHAKLLIQPDGSLAILDLDSANGTFVNGEQIVAGVPRVLEIGDAVTIGRWTRLRIEPRAV